MISKISGAVLGAAIGDNVGSIVDIVNSESKIRILWGPLGPNQCEMVRGLYRITENTLFFRMCVYSIMDSIKHGLPVEFYLKHEILRWYDTQNLRYQVRSPNPELLNVAQRLHNDQELEGLRPYVKDSISLISGMAMSMFSRKYSEEWCLLNLSAIVSMINPHPDNVISSFLMFKLFSNLLKGRGVSAPALELKSWLISKWGYYPNKLRNELPNNNHVSPNYYIQQSYNNCMAILNRCSSKARNTSVTKDNLFDLDTSLDLFAHILHVYSSYSGPLDAISISACMKHRSSSIASCIMAAMQGAKYGSSMWSPTIVSLLEYRPALINLSTELSNIK